MAAGDHHHHILIMLIYSWCANHVITFIHPMGFVLFIICGASVYRPVVRSLEPSSALIYLDLLGETILQTHS